MYMYMRRFISLLLCLSVVCSVLFLTGVPVSAAENDSGWVELLEFTSINENGTNKFTMRGTSSTLIIPLPVTMRLRKIDLLIAHTSNEKPTSAYVLLNGARSNLTVEAVSTALTRVNGYITTEFYSEIHLVLNKSASSTAAYEILSCKVSELHAQDFAADAYVMDDETPYTTNNEIFLDPDPHEATNHSFHLWVNDWQKYDYLSISVNTRNLIPLSFSAYIGNMPIDIDVSVFSDSDSGSWEHDRSFSDSGDNFIYTTYPDTTYGTRWISIYIPLINVDRTLTNSLRLTASFLQGVYKQSSVNFVSVTGGLFVADRSAVVWWNQYKEFSEQQSESWWDRYTDFSSEKFDRWWDIWTDQADQRTESWWDRFTEYMDGLFAGAADESNAAIESAQQQSQEIINDRFGAISQAGGVIDSVVGAFDGARVAQSTIGFPTLVMRFGKESFTFGGWNVDVIPDGFEPIVESLKLIIDIVATLAFVQALRNRFERLLAGGNA